MPILVTKLVPVFNTELIDDITENGWQDVITHYTIDDHVETGPRWFDGVYLRPANTVIKSVNNDEFAAMAEVEIKCIARSRLSQTFIARGMLAYKDHNGDIWCETDVVADYNEVGKAWRREA